MTCTCPPNATRPEDCLDCDEHGEDADRELAAEHVAEMKAEAAWQNVYAWIVHDV